MPDPTRTSTAVAVEATLAYVETSQLTGPFGRNGGLKVELPRLAAIENIVGVLLASWHCSEAVVQSRRYHRVPYPHPLVLQAVNSSGTDPLEEPRVARGRDLSAGGLSFFHQRPQPSRHFAVQFVDQNADDAAILMRVGWCRFTRVGHYQSGGQFLRTLPPILNSADEWRALPRA